MAKNNNVTVESEELKKVNETTEATVTEQANVPAEQNNETAEVKENWLQKAGNFVVGTVKKHGKGFAAGVGVTLVAGIGTLMALANKEDSESSEVVAETTATEVSSEE